MTNPTTRFTGLSKLYAAARPSYPADVIDYVMQTAQLHPQDKIADIGAGTGISARLFCERGLNVVAVEPNSDMRAEGEQSRTDFGEARIKFLDGTGESTGLPAGYFSLVLCAQAFHWLAPAEALKEFARILKPDGWVALIWNERDETDQFTKNYGDILRIVPETERVELSRLTAGKPLLTSSLFAGGHKQCYHNAQMLDLDGLINRAFSASYTPKKGLLASQVKQMLRGVFQVFENGGQVEMKYETSIYMARKSG